MGCFNPRPRERATAPGFRAVEGDDEVSIRARVNGRQLARGPTVAISVDLRHATEVSIRARVNGRPCLHHFIDGRRKCFNPRPRERATGGPPGHATNTQNVSIRARVNGRLKAGYLKAHEQLVSIRARVNGRPSSSSSEENANCCFNPRPRERATTAMNWPRCSSKCFNPRPRERATLFVVVRRKRELLFQSAPA